MSLSPSAAILVGFTIAGSLVGLGVYLGLRAQSPAAPPASGALPSPSAASVLPGAASPPPAPTASPTAFGDEAARAVAPYLDALRAQCWTRPAGASGPSRVTVTVNVAFDAEGWQVARSYEEDLDASRPDVTACIAGALPRLHVPAPGRARRVAIPITLP